MENILEYEDLIYKMIGRYRNFDKEDLYQAAMIGNDWLNECQKEL